jgi:cytochrome c553
MRLALTSIAFLLFTGPALAEVPIHPDADLRNGRDINELCAGCHGEFAQGGKEGEYPRLAGMPAAFIEEQMHLFRDRSRKNPAMIEYVDERQTPDDEIRDIAAYMARIELPTRLPPIDEAQYDPLERLLLARKTLNIPRAEGDVAKGERLYKRECRSCHGAEGWGDHRNGVPMLAGQYTNYLWRQVAKYRKGTRIHDRDDPTDRLLKQFSDEELGDMFAYLSVVDD